MACRISCRSFDGRCDCPFRHSVSFLFRLADGLSCSQYCKTSALCCSDKTLCRTVRTHASGTYDRHSPPSVPPWLWFDVQHCSHAAGSSCTRLFPPLLAWLSRLSCSVEYFFIMDLYCFSGSRPEMKFS